MNKLIFSAVLALGLLPVLQLDLFSSTTTVIRSSDTNFLSRDLDIQKTEKEERLLLAGNVPCNPAKQVCES